MSVPWFVYYRDLFRTVDLSSTVVTVDDAVRAGLKLAKELLGTASRYCVFEGPNELIIEYRSNEKSMKLINAECVGAPPHNEPHQSYGTGQA